MSTKKTPFWERYWFQALIIVGAVVPLLYPSAPIWGDMPAHLASYRVELDQALPLSPLHHFYSFRWQLQGNMGFDLLIVPMSHIFGIEFGVKLLLIGTVALAIVGMFAIAREVHGRITPITVFAVPLVYTFMFLFGAGNYSLSMALALCGFALWIRWGRLGYYKLRAIVFVIGTPLLWVCHVYGWAVLCVFVGTFEITRHYDLKRKLPIALTCAIIDCFVLFPPLVLMKIWQSQKLDFASDWLDIGNKVTFILHSFDIIWPISLVKSFVIQFIIGICLILFLCKNRFISVTHSLRLTLLTMLLLFVLMPTIMLTSYAADGRIFPYLMILFVLSLTYTPSDNEKIARRIAFAGLAFYIVQITAMTISFSQLSGDQERLLIALNHVPQGAKLVSFVGEGRYCADPHWNRAMNHLPSMATERRRAFANDQFSNEQLIKIIYPMPFHKPIGRRDYYSDESQLVKNPSCVRPWATALLLNFISRATGKSFNNSARQQNSLDYALQNLPRNEFDYIWLIRPPHFDHHLLYGTVPVWADDASAIYQINDHRDWRSLGFPTHNFP